MIQKLPQKKRRQSRVEKKEITLTKEEPLLEETIKDKRRRIHIQVYLTATEQDNFNSLYPEYNIVYENLIKHPHAPAAASKKLETEVILDKIQRTKKKR
jgi:hypothetical protein